MRTDKLKIGIIVSDIDEYKPFEKLVKNYEFVQYGFLGKQGYSFNIITEYGSANVILIHCGIGKVNAAAVTAHLVDIGCDVILNYGLSGGISKISRGELCVCDRFLEHDFNLTNIGYKPCEKPCQDYIYHGNKELIEKFSLLGLNFKCGTAVSGDCFVCDDDLRKFLKESFDAMTCDMETAAIAYVCEASHTPFLVLRRVSDDAGNDAKQSYREMNTSNETLLSDIIIDFIKLIIKNENESK